MTLTTWIERLRAATFKVKKPATAAAMERLPRSLGGRPPVDLVEFLSLTGGFSSKEFEFSFDCSRLRGEETLLGTMPRVYDYGNGDGLFLDVSSGHTQLWWIGHDPWDIIFVADSLEEWLRACVVCAETESSAPPWAPQSRARPSSFEQADATLTNDDERRFLATLPDAAVVFDLREATIPVEIPSDALPKGGGRRVFKRHGRVIGCWVEAEPSPPVGAVFVEKGIGYAMMEMFDLAIIEFRKALEHDPNDERAKYWLGEAEKRLQGPR